MTDFSPFNFFQQEITHPDITTRRYAAQNITIVAQAMGIENTRNTLFGYLLGFAMICWKFYNAIHPSFLILIEHCEDLEDELKVIISSQLSNFVPLVGGEDHAEVIIQLLEEYTKTNEGAVRKMAISSLASIISELPSHLTEITTSSSSSSEDGGGGGEEGRQSLGDGMMSLFRSLAQSDWFPSRLRFSPLFLIYNFFNIILIIIPSLFCVIC